MMMKNRLPDLKIPLDRRVGWVDLLRVLACFMVVFSHCCDPFVAAFDSDRTTFLQGVAAGSLVRASVPLFVMMTAVLLLPVRMELGAFYRKRIGRILVALVFWSLLLPVLYYLYMRWVGTSSPSIDPALFTGEATLRKLWTFVFNFTYDTTPLWYLYMLAGLYFIMPVITPWLERASKRDLHIVLSIWGFTLLIPYVKIVAPLLGYPGNYGNMGLYGECDWNIYGTFYYVSGFAGYLVLAFYLRKFPPAWSWRRMLALCIPAFAVGYLVTSLGFVEMQRHFPGNYAYLEIIWYFAGINVFLMTAPVFLIVQKAAARPRPWMARLAGATFGIYLCHFIFVQGAYDLVQLIPGIPAAVRIPLMALCAFAVSYAVVRAMQCWRVTRRFVE